MATMYILWLKDQANLAPIAGEFIASEAVNIDTAGVSALAPAGARVAMVWADVPFYYEPGSAPAAAKDSGSAPLPAGVIWPVGAVQPGVTKIAGIKI